MDLQKTILDESLSLYLETLVKSLKNKGSMPTLFPPKDLQLEELNALVRLVSTAVDFVITYGTSYIIYSIYSVSFSFVLILCVLFYNIVSMVLLRAGIL